MDQRTRNWLLAESFCASPEILREPYGSDHGEAIDAFFSRRTIERCGRLVQNVREQLGYGLLEGPITAARRRSH
jgi:hypothetical protein